MGDGLMAQFSEIFCVNQKCEEGKVMKSDGRCGKVLIKDHSKRYAREFVMFKSGKSVKWD